MPDWHEFISRELNGLALDDEQRGEVFAELALHLEEAYDAFVRQGVSEADAVKRTLLRAGDWRTLRTRIERARTKEDHMTDRVKQFWLPSLLTLFLSMTSLMIIQLIGTNPAIVHVYNWRMIAPAAVIYVPWLLSLLPIGAMGAYLASRARASQRAIFLSVVFPVLPYLALFLTVAPVSLILDDHIAHNVMLSALLVGLVAWVLLPAVALLAGGLPMQFLKRPSVSRQPASV